MLIMFRYIYLVLALAAAASAQNGNADEGNLPLGDIVLTPEQQGTLEATSNPNDPFAPQNAVVTMERSLWPNGVVPYVIDNLNSQAVSAINAAINTYAEETCIQFVQRTNQQDYVRFFQGQGCYSYIGRIGGPQDISIGNGCGFEGIVLHEMFHALGRWHEQSRPDRDMYVRIRPENIQSGTENNFDITNPSFVTTQGVPYDIRSIMHYSSHAFSKNNQPTIVPVDPSIPLSDLGQRNGLTNLDVQHVNTLYCNEGSPSGSWGSWSSWSSCSQTCNGGTRQRSRSCVGGTGCEGSNVQTQSCNTNSCPVAATWGSWSSYGACSATCGGGRQQRTRSCVGGNTCVGTSSQFRDCNTQSCPQPASWSSWGSWSGCSSTCQGGIRQRRRTCQNGNTCPGADFENQFCNSNVPCTSEPDSGNGEWGQWSSCSQQCGGGVRFRNRLCGSGNCDTEQESCNTRDCNPENLDGVRHRGCWYLNNRSPRLRLLEDTTPELSDNPFTRVDPIAKCGIAAEESNFDFFAVTLGYCISGSNLLSDYQYVESGLCQNGIGGYNRGFFIMDVFEVIDQQLFLDSANSAAVMGITTEEEEMAITDSDSGASAGAVYSLLAVSLTVMVAVFMY